MGSEGRFSHGNVGTSYTNVVAKKGRIVEDDISRAEDAKWAKINKERKETATLYSILQKKHAKDHKKQMKEYRKEQKKIDKKDRKSDRKLAKKREKWSTKFNHSFPHLNISIEYHDGDHIIHIGPRQIRYTEEGLIKLARSEYLDDLVNWDYAGSKVKLGNNEYTIRTDDLEDFADEVRSLANMLEDGEFTNGL